MVRLFIFHLVFCYVFLTWEHCLSLTSYINSVTRYILRELVKWNCFSENKSMEAMSTSIVHVDLFRLGFLPTQPSWWYLIGWQVPRVIYIFSFDCPFYQGLSMKLVLINTESLEDIYVFTLLFLLKWLMKLVFRSGPSNQRIQFISILTCFRKQANSMTYEYICPMSICLGWNTSNTTELMILS